MSEQDVQANENAKPRRPTESVLAAMLPRFDAANRLRQTLLEQLDGLREAAHDDPLLNPVQRLSHALSHQVEAGALDLDTLQQLIELLTLEAFNRRADGLGAYGGERNPDENKKRLEAVFRAMAHDGGKLRPFKTFQQLLESEHYGVVVTAHPTFSLNWDLRKVLERLASGYDEKGKPLDDDGRRRLLAMAAGIAHAPDKDITLAWEHQQAEAAIAGAQKSLRKAYAIALKVAAELYPDDWQSLTPRLMSLASWVGYDVDGRTDIGWTESLRSRMEVERIQLRRYLGSLRKIGASVTAEDDPDGDLATTLALIESRIVIALRMVSEESELFETDGKDPNKIREIAERLQRDDELRVVDTVELRKLLTRAANMAPSAGES